VDTVAVDDILLEEFTNYCGAYVGERLHFYLLREVFDYYNGEGVVTLRWG
jgi:hypothetical protein